MSEVRASLEPHSGDGRRRFGDEGGGIHKRLERQSLARPLSEAEIVLADALEDVYVAGAAGFDEVAAALTQRGIRAPHSREATRTVDLLRRELTAINESLDRAYASGGAGA